MVFKTAEVDDFSVLRQIESIGFRFFGNDESGKCHDLCPFGKVIDKFPLILLVDLAANFDHAIPVVRFCLVAVAPDGWWQQRVHGRFDMIGGICVEQVNMVCTELFDAVIDRSYVFSK